jgi:Icc-related predicted phosphoesterase
MKLLLFSDLHCNTRKTMGIVQKAAGVDIVVGAGDFANVRRGLEGVIRLLAAIDRPTVLVCGNSESERELADACRAWPAACVLHGSGTQIHQVSFYGLGGAVPVTPFGSWSYDLTEDEARDLLAGCPPGSVLVSHSPPKGTLDVSADGRSLGSDAVRTAIMQKQPRLVVCGHIHACAGQTDTLAGVPIVNAGPDGVMWDLELARPA